MTATPTSTPPPTADGLRQAERRLQAAQLAGDVVALDHLLDDHLVAIGPDGSRYTKDDDLAAHRSGSSVVSTLVEERPGGARVGDDRRHVRRRDGLGDLRGPADVGAAALHADLGARRATRGGASWRPTSRCSTPPGDLRRAPGARSPLLTGSAGRTVGAR